MSLDISLEATEPHTVYEANITHNLGKMASEAGIYYAVWRPDEVGIKVAGQLIPLLEMALKQMKTDPIRFKKFDSPNGWGLYEHFVPWIENLLTACQRYPHASIRVSR